MYEEDVIRWIFDKFAYANKKRKDLCHLEEVLEKLDNPHLNLKTIHIAGTNGKGSTVSFLYEILRNAGYNVGTFTSPHLEHFGERIALNGQSISADNLVKCANVLKPFLDESNLKRFAPFDVITLLSFIYFNDAKVDIVIYETGIGGRLDSTNVIVPLACGVTNVGDDHAEILGSKRETRALEKLGIAKEGVPLFTTEGEKTLLPLFETFTQQVGAPLFCPLKTDYPKNMKFSEDGFHFDFDGLEDFHLTMIGLHQIANAILAYSIVKFLNKKQDFTISKKHIYKGLKDASWPGRFEFMNTNPTVILDGAHNVDALEYLKITLEAMYPGMRKVFIVAMSRGKDTTACLEIIDASASHVIFTEFDQPSSMKAKDLFCTYSGGSSIWEENCFKAIDYAMNSSQENGIIVVCGSLYFIAEMRTYLKGKAKS